MPGDFRFDFAAIRHCPGRNSNVEWDFSPQRIGANGGGLHLKLLSCVTLDSSSFHLYRLIIHPNISMPALEPHHLS
jgi:hypothetical protein